MVKNYYYQQGRHIPTLGLVPKVARTMKLTCLLLCLSIGFVFANQSQAQRNVLSLDLSETTVSDVLETLEKQTDFHFFYNSKLVDVNRRISVNVKGQDLFSVLNQIFKDTNILYKVVDKDVILTVADSKSKAQDGRKVTGKVTDSRGEAIIGVNVIEKGTTNGTITDIGGNYSIDVPSGAVLVFSYIGYVSKDVLVGNNSVVNATLSEDMQSLDEVVVVSYGTQKKRDLTGSVSKVNADELSSIPVGQLGQKLQGQVAGVQINQVSGMPGQGMAFRIRGAASINGGNEPLFVVDGLPISTGLNNINPDEIESFSILKDAAATSLYGSRAANGVVLITTKRGKQGRTEVSLNASYGIQSIRGLKEPDVMNAREFAQFQKEFYEDKAKYEGYTEGVPEAYQHPEQYGEGTNWYKELTHSAPVQNYSLSISASKDKFNSAIVLGYFRQDGVLYNTNFERFSLRANNDYQVNDRLKLGLNIAPTLQLAKNQTIDGQRNLLSAATLASPLLSPYDANGDYVLALNAPNMFPQPNWRRVLDEKIDQRKTITVLSNMFAELDIWNGIKYKFQAGVDIGSNNLRDFTPSTAGGAFNIAPPQKATANFNTGFYYNWTVENMLMYNKTIKDHSIDALIGYTAQKYTWEGSDLSGTDFPDDDISWIDAAATKNGTSTMQQWAMASFIGRANYSFKDRYLLQVTFRRDGCSRFGSGNKYANFPSVSAGWIASDEAFMQPMSQILNYLKVRASYGLTGNYNIDNYNYLARVAKANYVLGGALAPGKALESLRNNELTWEETKQLDLGIDLGFLNDRIFVMYDYYLKRTDGMLYQTDIPAATGFWDIQSNMGDFKIWGHEITITSRNLVNEFKWTTNLNVSFNRNKILKLGTENAPIGGYETYGDFNRLEVGQPIGALFGYIYDGVYMTEQELNSQPKHATSEIGTARMVDVNNDKKIDADDRTIIGNPTPDAIFGMTNEFQYKNFDLSILLQGQIGGDIMNANYENTENLDGVFNVRKYVQDRWRSPENPGNGIVPRTKSGTTELFRLGHSGQVYDASYLAIKNVTLGYMIPFTPNHYISKLRVYLTAQQLAVFTKYPGLSPEVSQNGMDWRGLGVDRTAYPVPRTFSIGCNITF